MFFFSNDTHVTSCYACMVEGFIFCILKRETYFIDMFLLLERLETQDCYVVAVRLTNSSRQRTRMIPATWNEANCEKVANSRLVSDGLANMIIYPNIFTFELLVACIQPLGALRDAIAAAKNAQLPEEEIAPIEA